MARPVALVTGSAGFVGRHVVRYLIAQGYDVKSCDLRPWTFERDGYHTFWREDAVDWLPRWSRADLLVHCAYNVGGRAAIDGSKVNLQANLRLDTAMFRWVLRHAPNRLIYFSSSAAYPVKHQREGAINRLCEGMVDFDDLEQPDADYGWAKLTGERVARNIQSLGQKITVVRPFSGHGSDQDLDYPFPTFVKRIANRLDPFPIWGDATQRRDWIHIDDVIAGTFALADADVTVPVNLCTGVATSMLDLVQLMADVAGVPHPSIEVKEDMPYGVHTRVGDPTLLRQFYTPRVDLLTSVTRAIAASQEMDWWQ